MAAVAFLSFPAGAEAELVDGLLNYWNLDAGAVDAAHGAPGSASTAQNDGSVEGTPGSVSFVPADGPFSDGYALFDGTDGYIEVATGNTDIDRSGQSLSISVWFRVDVFDTSWQALLAKGEGNDYRIARRDNGNSMSYAGGAQDIPDFDLPFINDGMWHHLVATTQHLGNTQLFIDGALVQTRFGAANIDAFSFPGFDNTSLFIGENPEEPGRNWNGGIDDLAMWDRVLTNDEIAAIWNGGTGATIGSLIVPTANLAIEFTDDPVLPGGTVTLEFTLTNADPANAAADLAFTLDLSAALPGLTATLPPTPNPPCGPGSSLTGSAGDTFLTFVGGELAAAGSPGDSCTFSVTLSVPAGAGRGDYTATASTLTGTLGGDPIETGPATDDLTVFVGGADPILAPGDPILGGQLVGGEFQVGVAGFAPVPNNWPEGEPPEDLINGVIGGGGEKYLNFAKLNTGVIVTPAVGASIVTSITLWSANDAPERDPASFQLFGTNEAIAGDGPFPLGLFDLIAEGAVMMPLDRDSTADDMGFDTTVEFANDGVFKTYMLIFPTVRDEGFANSMQVSEVQFGGPTVRLAMDFTDDPVAPGDSVTLEFTLTNTDPDNAAADLAFTLDLDAVLPGLTATLPPAPNPPCGPGSSLAGSLGDTFLTFAGGTLDPAGSPGDSCTFSVSLDVPPGAMKGIYPSSASTLTGFLGATPIETGPATFELVVALPGETIIDPLPDPFDLIDGEGFEWDVEPDGGIDDGTDDAYDGGHEFSDFPDQDVGVLRLDGRELVLGPAEVDDDIVVERRIFVPDDDGFARFLEVVTNTGIDPQTFTIELETDLGSDDYTMIRATSSGDLEFTVDDNWIVTDDDDEDSDPTVLHLIAGPGGQRPEDVFAEDEDEYITYSFELVLAPGETQIVMHFGAQNPHLDTAAAVAKAERLIELPEVTLRGIPADELGLIVNWDIFPAEIEPVVPDPRTSEVDVVRVVFGEPVDPASFDFQDLSLTRDGGPNLIDPSVTVTPLSDTEFEIGGLGPLTADPGDYLLTLSGAAILDDSGIPLGGETAEAWTFDRTFMALDRAHEPLGSLVYSGVEERGLGEAPGDVQSLEVTLDGGQTLAVLVEPDDDLQVAVELLDPAGDPCGSGAAPDPGEAVLLPAVQLAAGTYTIRISSLSGTTGDFEVTAFLNAALESEEHGGPVNDSSEAAEDLDPAITELLPGLRRGAVLGRVGVAALVQTIRDTLFDPNVVEFVFSGLQPANPLSPGLVTLSLEADLDSDSEFITLDIEGVVSVVLFDDDGDFEREAEIDLSPGELQALLADGVITVTLTPSERVDDDVSPEVFVTVGIEYELAAELTPDLEDWYRFQADAGEPVTVALSGEVEGVDLFDAAGAMLQSSTGEASNLDHLIADFAVPADGSYFVRVTGSAASRVDYNLVVTRGISFERERNDTLDDAPEFGLGGGVLGHVTAGFTVTVTPGPAGEEVVEEDDFDFDLVDGEGFLWDIEPDGEIDDGGGDEGDDAFDEGLQLAGFGDQDEGRLRLGGRELALGPDSVGDVEVERRIYVPDDDGFARFLEIVTNNSADPQTFTVSLYTDLDPGDDEIDVVSTSSGDLNFTVDDDWIITEDNEDESAIVNLLFGREGAMRPSFVEIVDDNITFEFELELAPGETQIVMHVAAQSDYDDREGALAKAERLAALPDALFFGMTAAEIDLTVNLQTDRIDYFAVDLEAGDVVGFATLTPAGGAGEFVNELDPKIELFDPGGALLASDDNSAADGRNALLNLEAPVAGRYVVGVSSSGGSEGEYLLLKNAQPSASDDDYTTGEDASVSGNIITDDTGAGSDGDPDPGDTLRVVAVDGDGGNVGSALTLASGALLTVEGDGSFTYDPNGQFEALPVGDSSDESFTYTIEDRGGLSASATVTVTVEGRNDAPVLDPAGDLSLTAITELTAPVDNPGTTVAVILASAPPVDVVSDIDEGDPEGIAVVGASLRGGRWEFSLDGGGSWSPLATPSEADARLLDVDARVRFLQRAGFHTGNAPRPTIEFRAWDQSSGTNGGQADLAAPGATGGSTAFSSGEVESASIEVIHEVDLIVSAIGPVGPVVAGSSFQNLTYFLAVQNAGFSAVASVVLDASVVVPAGGEVDLVIPSVGAFDAATGRWTIPNLPRGKLEVLTVIATIGPSAAVEAGAAMASLAVVSADALLANPGDDTDSVTTDVTREVDLAVAVTESVDPVVADGVTGGLTYIVSVKNEGPSDATGVSLNNVLTLVDGVTLESATPSAGTFDSPWAIGDLAEGEGATLTLVLTAARDAVDGAMVNNAAGPAMANETLVNTGDDSATATTTVQRRVDLRVTITDAPDPVEAGSGAGNLTYTVTVQNLGPSDASGVALTNAVAGPAGVTAGAGTPTAGTFDGATWTLGNLAWNTSAQLTVPVTVDGTVAEGQTVTDTASGLVANELLINPSDDAATATTEVLGRPELSVQTTATPDPVLAGGSGLTFTVTVSNTGSGTGRNLRLQNTLTLPQGVSLRPSGSTSVTAGSFGGDRTWTIPALAGGASATMTIRARVALAAADGAEVVSTTQFLGAQPRLPAETTSTLAVPVARRANLTLVQFSQPGRVRAGSGAENLVIVATVTNLGPSTASGVEIALDRDFPEGVEPDYQVGTGAYSASLWRPGDIPAETSFSLISLFTVGASTTPGEGVLVSTLTATAPAGTLTATGDDADTLAISVDAPGQSEFPNWQLVNFGSETVADADPRADPDNDQLNNVTEFGLGLDPNTPDAPGITMTMLEVGGAQFLQVEYKRRLNATGLTYAVEVSTNLSDRLVGHDFVRVVGVPVPVDREPAYVAGELECVTVRPVDPIPSDGVQSIQIRVTLARGP